MSITRNRQTYRNENIVGATISSAFSTGLVCMLRASEFSVKAGNIDKVVILADAIFWPSFRECTSVRIKIKAGKTDLFRSDAYVYLTKMNYEHCPIRKFKICYLCVELMMKTILNDGMNFYLKYPQENHSYTLTHQHVLKNLLTG